MTRVWLFPRASIRSEPLVRFCPGTPPVLPTMTPGRKALIIDDSAMLLRYAVSVLGTRMPGLEVLTARRGGEGFYQADKLRPDLLLVDHALPDTPGEALCRRLEQHPGTAALPVILLCGQGTDPQAVGAGHPNVVGVLSKPFTPEELSNAVRTALAVGPRPDAAIPPGPGLPAAVAAGRHRARLQVPPSSSPAAKTRTDAADPASRIVFRGTTATFSLKAAVHAAVGAHDRGVLRFTVPTAPSSPASPPTEVYLRAGRVVLVTTRDPEGYHAPGVTTPPFPDDDAAAEVLRREQRATGCPPFLALLATGKLPETDALLATADHGQRLFARLWTRPRLDFEFERLTELPDFVRRLPEQPPNAPAPAPAPDLEGLDEDTREAVRLDDWLLGTLRRLRPEDLPELGADGHERFDGVPAYTREGYAAIRRLQLTDLEAAFARQVNGRADLRALAGRLGLGNPAAFLLLFRFRAVELMDLWPAGALARHPAPGGNDGQPHSSPVDTLG